MSEFRRADKERKAEEWADRSRDEDETEPYEQTYRDGSLKNECWRSDDR